MSAKSALVLPCALLLLSVCLLPSYPAARDGYGLAISLGGGLGLSEPDVLNEAYIDDFAMPVGILSDHLEHRFLLWAEYEYPLLARLNLAFGVAYTRNGVEKTGHWRHADEAGQTVQLLATETRLSARLWAPHVRLRYVLVPGQPSMFVSAGAVYGLGKVVLETTATPEGGGEADKARNEYTARRLGALLGAGARWRLTSRLHLSVESGYRYLDLGLLRDSGDKVWQVEASGQTRDLSLDFNGVYFIGYLTLEI